MYKNIKKWNKLNWKKSPFLERMQNKTKQWMDTVKSNIIWIYLKTNSLDKFRTKTVCRKNSDMVEMIVPKIKFAAAKYTANRIF